MKENFEKCLMEVLHHEGGWADHPEDPGGATMKGVTIGTFAQFKGRKVTKQELRAISDADLRAIYRRNYWDKVRGDNLPAGLDLVAFDAAVNSGPARGARWLQRALGVSDDGMVGPATVLAAQSADVQSAINAALDIRLKFLRGLKTWPTFGKGWGRRVEAVRKVALGMAAAKPAIVKPQALPRTAEAVDPVHVEPAPAASGIGAAIAAGAALIGAAVAAGWDWIASFFGG